MSYILTCIAFDIEPCLCNLVSSYLCFCAFSCRLFPAPTFGWFYSFLFVDFYRSYTPSTSPLLPFVISLFFFIFKEVSQNLLKRKTTNHKLSSRWSIYNSCLPPLPKEENANNKQFYFCNLSIKYNMNYCKHFWVPRGMLCLKRS